MSSFDPRNKRRPGQKPSAPSWMTTYGDMVTLLLTFFGLLFSFTSMDEQKFKQVAGSLRGALGVVQQSLPFQGAAPGPIGGTDYDLLRRSDILNSVESLRDALNEFTKDGSINIEATESGILIQMGDKILFDPGKAELKPQALDILSVVGKSIRNQASDIQVAGH
ncbi:MAG: flagellar motor protein MotB, partial [Fidelibacterota bacterium]